MTKSIEVLYPSATIKASSNTRSRVYIEFQDPKVEDISSILGRFIVPIFKSDDYNVLVKDLSSVWNYPSSYQLIKKIVKHTKIDLNEYFKTTDNEMNTMLLEKNVIKKSDLKFKLFYIDLKFLYSVIKNKEIFFSVDEKDDFADEKHLTINEDKISISQVFPQYGLVSSTMELNHSSFNSLNRLSKLNYYKSLPNSYKYLPNSKLSFSERELIIKENDYSEIKINEQNSQSERKKFRKPIGKSKKHNINIDPNSIDLTDSVIPGQGYIPEFNVNHLCKVPNYYITSNQQNSTSFVNLKKINATSNSSFLFNDNIKMSKNIQQLVFNNENDNYNHSKYYYTKSYRGPGSGNYKDAALMNKINRIPLTTNKLNVTHKISKDVDEFSKRRYNHSLKGLVYEKFNKDLVDSILSKQRKYTEDYVNLEMLHNNLQFNLLINTYREISQETWENYYKFKLIDFEQLAVIKNEGQSDLIDKFTLPTDHKEIIRNLPVEMRNDKQLNEDGMPSIKKPMYYAIKYEDQNNPELLNKIDIIKFPNSNSIGWVNLKKYRDD